MNENFQGMEPPYGFDKDGRLKQDDEGFDRAANKKKKSGVTRRGLFKILAGAAVTGVGSKIAFDKGVSDRQQKTRTAEMSPDPEQEPVVLDPEPEAEFEPESQEPDPEPEPEAEAVFRNERFEAIKSGWKVWWTIPINQVQFLDSTGRPVGTPIEIKDAYIPDPKHPGERLLGDIISAGGSETGSLLENIHTGLSKNWITHHRINTPGARKLVHVLEEAEAALDTHEEPALAAAVTAAVEKKTDSPTVASVSEIAGYYGMNSEKPVPGDQWGRTLAQYIEEEIILTGMSDNLKKGLRDRMVGLVAKESLFNDTLGENSYTAKAAWQLTDDVRQENGYARKADLSFIQEVEVAGKHISKSASQIERLADYTYNSKHELVKRPDAYLNKIKACFRNEQEFETYFLLPAIITAYNAGAWRVGEAIAFFVRDYASELERDWQNSTGYDLFMKMSEYAHQSSEGLLKGWGDDVVAYFPAIDAASDVLTSKTQIALAQ